jgi:hypothetical protein
VSTPVLNIFHSDEIVSFTQCAGVGMQGDWARPTSAGWLVAGWHAWRRRPNDRPRPGCSRSRDPCDWKDSVVRRSWWREWDGAVDIT